MPGREPFDPLGRTLFERRLSSRETAISPAPGQWVCDFCLAPDPKWEYECGVVAVVGNPAIDASDDEWAACDECRELIESGDVDAMVKHMVAAQAKHITDANMPNVAFLSTEASLANARQNFEAFLNAKRSDAKPLQR